MSEHNEKTIDMYNLGGALEYIGHNDIEPENEGGKEQRNWHVLTLRKIKMGEI